MSKITVCVGFDYHDDSIRCASWMSGQDPVKRLGANSGEQVIHAVRQFGANAVCAVEACCGAADFAHELGVAYGLGRAAGASRLRPPAQAESRQERPRRCPVVGRPGACAVSAGGLARADGGRASLRRLVRYRQQLKRNRAEIKLQIRALLAGGADQAARARPGRRPGGAWLETTDELSEVIRWILNEQLARLRSKLDEAGAHVRRSSRSTRPMIRDTQRSEKHSGIGIVTAVTLCGGDRHFRRFRQRQATGPLLRRDALQCLERQAQADAGLVKGRQPGAAGGADRGRSPAGAARSASGVPSGTSCGQRKPYNVAMAAVANRWLRWLYHEMIREKGSPASRLMK